MIVHDIDDREHAQNFGAQLGLERRDEEGTVDRGSVRTAPAAAFHSRMASAVSMSPPSADSTRNVAPESVESLWSRFVCARSHVEYLTGRVEVRIAAIGDEWCDGFQRERGRHHCEYDQACMAVDPPEGPVIGLHDEVSPNPVDGVGWSGGVL